MPHLVNAANLPDTVFAEYTGEGTVRPMMMIRRGPWKYITCPADVPQFYNLERDPQELDNLARFAEAAGIMTNDEALAFLNSNELKEEVAKRCEEAQKKNISGVPFTIINHKWAVGGCQNADVYFKVNSYNNSFFTSF